MPIIWVPEVYEEGCVCDAISLCVPSFQKEMCLHHHFLIALTLSAVVGSLCYSLPFYFFICMHKKEHRLKQDWDESYILSEGAAPYLPPCPQYYFSSCTYIKIILATYQMFWKDNMVPSHLAMSNRTNPNVQE